MNERELFLVAVRELGEAVVDSHEDRPEGLFVVVRFLRPSRRFRGRIRREELVVLKGMFGRGTRFSVPHSVLGVLRQKIEQGSVRVVIALVRRVLERAFWRHFRSVRRGE